MSFEGHTNNITGVAFHCEGKWMVTSSEDCTVKVWDTRTGLVQRAYTHDYPVNDVVIHPNQGELVSADRGGVILIWDLGDDKCTHQLIPEEDVPISSVSIASDGSLLAAGNNKVNLNHLFCVEILVDLRLGRRLYVAHVSRSRFNHPSTMPSLQCPQNLPHTPPPLS